METTLEKVSFNEIVDVRFMDCGIMFTKTLRYLGGKTFFDADMFDGFGGEREISSSDIFGVWAYR